MVWVSLRPAAGRLNVSAGLGTGCLSLLGTSPGGPQVWGNLAVAGGVEWRFTPKNSPE